MRKKVPLLVTVLALLLSAYTPILSAQVLHRADCMVCADVGGPESVDPAWAYDTASAILISNVYDTLIRFDVDRSLDPTTQGLLDQFVPSLALSWTIEDIEEYDAVADETWLQKSTFTMRNDITWHYGTVSSAADMARHAEYSFERWMVQDRSGGSAWLILDFVLGVSRVPHPPDATEAETERFAHKIDQAIQRSGDTVIIRRNTRKLPLAFLQILAQNWASILCKEWCVALGDWPGFGVTGYTWAGWGPWHDPAVSPIDAAGHPIMGTGPYELDLLIWGVEWSIVAHEDYWGGWPSPASEPINVPYGDPDSWAIGGGYFRRIKFEICVAEWTLRKAGLLDGTYDMVYVPRPNIDELIVDPGPPEQYLEGIRCFQPLAVLAEQNVFFNFNASTATMWAGPGFDPANPYLWGNDRIPIDFFDDPYLRKAFAFSWDGSTYIDNVLLGEATQPATHHKMELPYYNPPPPLGTGPEPYPYNPTGPWSAEYYFKMAWGGTDPNNDGVVEPGDEGLAWTSGFRFSLTYVAGVNEWATAGDLMKNAVEGVHPTDGHFNIDVTALKFGTAFLPDLFARELTMFITGWQAVFADPHDDAHAYMHTEGTLFWCQSGEAMTGVDEIIDIPAIGWSGTSDQLIEDASYEPDYDRREAMYFKLQDVFHERVINIPISQVTGRHWQRKWIKGWYFNPLFGGSVQGTAGTSGLYFYHYWRRMAADLNYAGKIDILDKWKLDDQWGPKFTPGIGVNYRADINMDGFVNLKDKFYMYARWGDVDPYQH